MQRFKLMQLVFWVAEIGEKVVGLFIYLWPVIVTIVEVFIIEL